MPSGYTSDLYEGKEVSFEKFVLQCARGMGAAIMLRDHDPRVLPTPDNVTSGEYAEEKVAEAQARHNRFLGMSNTELEAVTAEYNREMEEGRQQAIEKNDRIRKAYMSMFAKVEAWAPPTPDHVGLKELMLQQLTQSLDFDVDTDPGRFYKTRTPAEHRHLEIEAAQRNIDMYTRIAKEDRERNEGRVRWTQELYDSLGVKPGEVE